ncbi:MAG: tRNA nucleotidyltransferase [Devosia sp.]|uniref:CCA tRNA nucleotidyltransferase n=1 Tax=Devosia sp. TaxID=1871048 RepID=UPI00260F6DAD|nr:CCA tRNA nucleotidyltransferase [Devosia sp.]MDB5589238.1 tRNA nucleotidyltransferase [Devosia sp.]
MSALATAEARLREAAWLKRAETQTIFAVLDGAIGRTRVVGGVVRDTLLDRHRDNPDIDFATELLPTEVIDRAAAAGIASYPTGIDHGTITLRLGDVVAEVTTLRRDVETDGRHAQVAFGTDWTEDAQRRDFTLNALYAEPSGALFDPLDGLDDCLSGRVRFIGEAAQRIAEDGLRVFRFFRFSASHGGETYDPAGLAACAAAAGHLGHLSAERVGAEMTRMLSLPQIAATLRAMTRIGLEPINEDTLALLKTYERQAGRPQFHARLALILEHQPADALQQRWRLSNADIDAALAIKATSALLRAFKVNEAVYRYADYLGRAIDVAAVLAGWGEAGKVAITEQVDAIDPPKFPVGGRDLLALGMRPGPDLGNVLDRLERQWVESGFTLDRPALLELAKA